MIKSGKALSCSSGDHAKIAAAIMRMHKRPKHDLTGASRKQSLLQGSADQRHGLERGRILYAVRARRSWCRLFEPGAP